MVCNFFNTRILFFLFFLSAPVFVYETQAEVSKASKSRPKIGLVLAGGGALGIAHVGVLEVLEENRIPIDVVTGTSMGAIVGAAYAAGVPIEHMKKVLTTTDWDATFAESPNRADVVYRLKPGREREIFGDAKIAIKDGKIVTPAGFIQGQNVLPILQSLYEHVPTPANFDELPIPFRAVTANLETGKAYVPNSGNLSKIVRASMSVPGAFTPVEIDDKLLVDGGIANNLPVNIALEMGADVLIVVELYADLAKREDLNGPFAISGQIISLLLAQNAEIQRGLMRKKDILVAPQLTGFTPMDFGKGKKLMKLGRVAAEKELAKLQNLTVSEEAYEEFRQRRVSKKSERMIDEIRIANSSRLTDGFIEAELHTHVGQKFDSKKIDADVRRIYSTGYFSDVSYSFENEQGKNVLSYNATGKEWLNEYVRLGASIEDDFSGNTFFGLAGNYHQKGLNSWGAELDTQAEIGTNPKLFAEWYQPLGEGSPYFLAPQAGLGRNNILFRRDGDTVAQYERTNIAGGLFFGRELSRYGQWRIGYVGGDGELERSIGEPSLPDIKYGVGEFSTAFIIDQLDTPDFPTTGYLFTSEYLASLEDVGAEDDFEQFTSLASKPFTWGQNTISLTANIGHTFGTRPLERSFINGGFFNLSGYPRNSIVSSDYAIGRLAYYRKLGEIKSPLFGFDLFAGGTFEIGNFTSSAPQIPDAGTINAGSLFVGVDTPLIPIYFGIGAAEGGEGTAYMAIGRVNSTRK
jgi:NTE family protein